MTATILLHPAVAADYMAAQALADRLGLQVTLEGNHALLEPSPARPGATPARIPAPSSCWGHRATRPTTGGDAA